MKAASMIILQSLRSLSAFQLVPKPKAISSTALLYGSRRKNLSTIRMTSSTPSNAVPRAAVSVVVRHSPEAMEPRYVLVQRGKEPNKGIWSLPGGSIESGEESLSAAKRELWEETGLSVEHTIDWDLQWCEDGPICTTDSIHFAEKNGSNVVQFHYVISQWFVEITKENTAALSHSLPHLAAADDASDAKWFDLAAISEGVEKGEITPGVEKVVLRSELMFEKGFLL